MKKIAMKFVYPLVVGLLISLGSMAQKNGVVRGVLVDTLAHQPVPGATLTVMLRKDSSLVSFAMTDDHGRFEFDGLAEGDYRLLITHVNYHNSNRYFSITGNKKLVDLGNLPFHDKAKVLEEVVVTSEAPPVTLIGDTLQYNAGSFKTPPNASVEALLKKLPGVEVDKDGTVKAQGEKVKKVLVDGKEFFGNDPKIATRNLPADAIDKVQVYDKQSDQSQLTGFDDGNSEKTINLKLKKDKKKGVFGKAMAGYGTDQRYESRFNLNSFKGARQLSMLGMANNDNAEGFSFMDMLNFTGELGRIMQGGNGAISISSNDALAGLGGMGGNSGIRKTMAGGFNYNDIFGKKTDFQSNYFYSRYNPNTETHSQRQYFLNDSTYYTNQNSYSDNVSNSHRLNMTADIIIDSFHSLKINPSLGYQQNEQGSLSDYENFSSSQARTVKGYRRNLGESTGLNFRNDILFRKKFRRKGRTFSLLLQNSYNKGEGSGTLESVNNFFDQYTGNPERTDSINQRYSTESSLNGYTAKLVYTEPLFRYSLLEFSVANSSTNTRDNKLTYDYNKLNGKFDQLNPKLTNNFKNKYDNTLAGLRFRYQRRSYNFTLGANWQNAGLEGKIIADTKDSTLTQRFVNILPNARFQYNFTRYRNITLNYTTRTNQPTAEQLQPVRNNSDPLNIREGNPGLKQEFDDNVRLQFTTLDPFRNKNFFMFLDFNRTNNKIVNSDQIDSNVRVSRPVNVNGVYRAIGNLSWGFPITALKGRVSLGSNIAYLRNKQVVRGVENTSNTLTIGPTFRLYMPIGDKIDWTVEAGVTYNKTGYSLTSARSTRYLSQQYSTDFDWELPAGFFFSTDFVYTINNQLADGFNLRVPFWNASISKQFLKYKRGELKLKAFDLLKQNLGISRNSNQNYIEDIRQRNLQRFFLLSFTYSLSKVGQGGSGSGHGVQIKLK